MFIQAGQRLPAGVGGVIKNQGMLVGIASVVITDTGLLVAFGVTAGGGIGILKDGIVAEGTSFEETTDPHEIKRKETRNNHNSKDVFFIVIES